MNGVFDPGTTLRSARRSRPPRRHLQLRQHRNRHLFRQRDQPSWLCSTAAIAGSGVGTTSIVQSSDRVAGDNCDGRLDQLGKQLPRSAEEASISGPSTTTPTAAGDFTAGETGIGGVTVSYSGGTPATSGSVTTAAARHLHHHRASGRHLHGRLHRPLWLHQHRPETADRDRARCRRLGHGQQLLRSG